MSVPTIYVPPDRRLPDEGNYINCFEVKSETPRWVIDKATGKRVQRASIYKISQHKTGRWWACSCPGWITHRHCKHLERLQLPCHNRPYEVQLGGGGQ
jgi:hypothetical protein